MLSLRYTSEWLAPTCTTNGATTAPLLLDKLTVFSTEIARHQEKIEQSLAHTQATHTFDDVVSMVLKGALTLWTFGSSFALLEVHHFPRMKTLHVFLAGGNPEELAAMQDALAERAQQLGCSACTVSGRPGWARYLKPHGWRLVTVGLWRDVQPMEAPHGQRRQDKHYEQDQTGPRH